MANADETGIAKHDFDAWLGGVWPKGPERRFDAATGGWWTNISLDDLRAAYEAGRETAMREVAP